MNQINKMKQNKTKQNNKDDLYRIQKKNLNTTQEIEKDKLASAR